MASQAYAQAPEKYFTNFRRDGTGIHGALQRIYTRQVIEAKERYFAWAQSLYITSILSSAGILNPKQAPTVAILGSGIPFLERELGKDKIRAVSIDSNVNLGQLVEREYSLRAPVLLKASSVPLQDESVNLAVSHNYLQKLQSETDAKKMAMEMLRISKDYAIIQVTPGNHPLFMGDKTHNVALTTEQWQETVANSAKEYGNDWHLRETHTVKIADSIPIGRPPVFILERGSHPQVQRDISHIRRSTRAALVAEEEATLANLISASRPALAAYVLHELEGIAQSLSIGGVMAMDAVDGIIARKFRPSPLGGHVDRIADHAVAAISYFSLGYPVFGWINAARDGLVDAVALKVDESPTNRRKAWSRYSYGLAKGATFMIAPLSHAAGEVFAVASTAFSFYRAADLLRGLIRHKKD